MEKTNDNLKSKTAFYGFRKAFIHNADISPESRLLLIDLMTYKGENTECWPSQTKLSKDIGRNKDSIRKYLKELISNGYLKVHSRGIGRSLLYAPSYWKISSGYVKDKSKDEKPAEEIVDQPAESTLNRSISSGNKVNEFKSGKELFDQKRKELEL
jgi:hypothetical protein